MGMELKRGSYMIFFLCFFLGREREFRGFFLVLDDGGGAGGGECVD